MVASTVFQVWLRLETHPEDVMVEVRSKGEWVRA
jgi:hypothetical protein